MADTRHSTPMLDSSTRLEFDRAYASQEQLMMSWIRVATSLITFGFSVYKFFQLEVPSSKTESRLIGPREFALMLVSMGLVSLLIATIQHRQNIKALIEQYDRRRRSMAGLLGGLISVFGIVALLAVIFRQ